MDKPLAMSIPVDSAFAVPSEIADENLAARLLSGVVGKPQEEIEARFESSRSFAWIARKLPPEKADAISKLNLKGIYLQKENQRFYPKRDLAAHVLGFVDVDEKGLMRHRARVGQPDSRQERTHRSDGRREAALV